MPRPGPRCRQPMLRVPGIRSAGIVSGGPRQSLARPEEGGSLAKAVDRRERSQGQPGRREPSSPAAGCSPFGRRVLLMHEPFSLLVSVYDGDRPDYLRRAFRSAVHDQTVRPDEVIIVRDGPVRAELAECLDELRETSPVPVTFIPLPSNRGLGPALDQGVAASW